jgi:hypothetical protein
MVNLETAITDGSCPDPQPKSFDFFAPASALTALQSAGVTLVTEANNHGEDCGPGGLQMALSARTQSKYTVLGIGQNAAEAFTPYQTVIDGEHIGIIAATQVIDDDLQVGWTATTTQPGLASAYDVSDLVSAVEAARLVDDTLVVFLHWGVELDTCPDPCRSRWPTSWCRPEPTSSWAATRTCCSVAATSVRPTSTTGSAISPFTTPPLPRTKAVPSSSPPRAATSMASPGGRR